MLSKLDRELKEKSDRLKVLQEWEGPLVVREIKNLQKDIYLLMDQEDFKWKQHAKRHWYKHGDHNTKFFHACANQHRSTSVPGIFNLKLMLL